MSSLAHQRMKKKKRDIQQIPITAVGYFEAGERPEMMEKVWQVWAKRNGKIKLVRDAWLAGAVKLVVPTEDWERIQKEE